SFPPDIAEVAMLHNVGSKMERVYNRGQLLDQRRHLMNAWAAFCAAPATADVLTFKRACQYRRMRTIQNRPFPLAPPPFEHELQVYNPPRPTGTFRANISPSAPLWRHDSA